MATNNGSRENSAMWKGCEPSAIDQDWEKECEQWISRHVGLLFGGVEKKTLQVLSHREPRRENTIVEANPYAAAR